MRENDVINLNDRYRTIQRPGDSRLVTPITGRKGDPPPHDAQKPPAAMKRAKKDEDDDEDDEEDEESVAEKKPNAASAPAEAKKTEGPKLPPRVESARINKSALYHFQH